MVRLEPVEYLQLLLKAHGAEDAFEPAEDEPWPAEEIASSTGAVDLGPVFGLLASAESLAGIPTVTTVTGTVANPSPGTGPLHAAAAA